MIENYPQEILDYAKKHNLQFRVETWFQDDQHYQDWHYVGDHNHPVFKEEYPPIALIVKEHKDNKGKRIRFQLYLGTPKPKQPGQRVFREKKLIYEFRDNGGFVGIYIDKLNECPQSI